MTKFRVVPWRGPVTGNVYYNVQRAGVLFWRNIITCFTELEAEEMLSRLQKWGH